MSNWINLSIILFIGSVNIQLKYQCVIENERITLVAPKMDHYKLNVPSIHE